MDTPTIANFLLTASVACTLAMPLAITIFRNGLRYVFVPNLAHFGILIYTKSALLLYRVTDVPFLPKMDYLLGLGKDLEENIALGI